MTRRKEEDETGVAEETLIPEDAPQEETPVGINVSENSEAEATVIEALVAPIELVLASEDTMIDDKINIDTQPNSAEQASHTTIVYKGDSDLVSHGSYRFRPGQPVRLPSIVAEELLRNPFERFEAKEF